MSQKRFHGWCQIPAQVAVQHQLVANHCEGLAQAVLALGHLVFRLDHREVGAGVDIIHRLHLAGRARPTCQPPSSRRLAAADTRGPPFERPVPADHPGV